MMAWLHEFRKVRLGIAGNPQRAIPPQHLDGVRFEQVRALYKNAPFGTIAASCVAFLLALFLDGHAARIGAVSKPLLWSLIVIGCCAVHLILCMWFRRARDAQAHWRLWLFLFTGMALFEGLAWCLGAIWLLSPSNFTESIVILLAWAGITSAGVSVFGVYPPTFVAFLYPAMVPHLVFALIYRPPYYALLAALEIAFLVALPIIAIGYSGQMVQAYRLQFANQDLAEAFRAEKERAEQASLAKSKFLAAASHDLRQPVHALALFLAALQDQPLGGEARKIAERMDTSILVLGELFSALLDISKLDAGAISPEFGVFGVDSLLLRIANDVSEEALAKGVALRLVPTTLYVRSDPVLLEQVLRNLVFNAVKYTERGGVTLGCRREGRSVRFEVWDTGRGIPPDDLGQIFQEFYQVDNVERDRTKGLGLGLAIVERTAALLGAELGVRSELGRGSVFTVRVERAAALAKPPALAVERESQAAHILVIDDDPDVLAAMDVLLSGWGHTVTIAKNSVAGLAGATLPSAPDLIISDYRLPGESGAEAIRRVRTHFGWDIPAMLVTGDTSPQRIAEAGASGLLVLHKPVVKSRLRAAVGNLLPRDPQPA